MLLIIHDASSGNDTKRQTAVVQEASPDRAQHDLLRGLNLPGGKVRRPGSGGRSATADHEWRHGCAGSFAWSKSLVPSQGGSLGLTWARRSWWLQTVSTRGHNTATSMTELAHQIRGANLDSDASAAPLVTCPRGVRGQDCLKHQRMGGEQKPHSCHQEALSTKSKRRRRHGVLTRSHAHARTLLLQGSEAATG